METKEQENKQQIKEQEDFKFFYLTMNQAIFVVITGVILILMMVFSGKMGFIENFIWIFMFWIGIAICSIRNTFLESQIKKSEFNAVLDLVSKQENLTARKIQKILDENSEETKDILLKKWGAKKMVKRLENYGFLDINGKIVPGYKITEKGLELLKARQCK